MDAATRSGNGEVSAVVEYDYTAKEPDELDLVKGAVIHNIKQMPGGWWEGTLQSTGKTGMFPDNFVRVMDPSDESGVVLRDKSAIPNRRCKVIYSYTQVNDDELSLAVGDVIEFLGEVEEGWWRGRLRNKTGVFPSNFVIAIEQSPIFASKRPTAVNATGAAAASITTTVTAAVKPATATSSTTNNAVNHIPTGASSSKKSNRLSLHSSKEDLLSATASAKAGPSVMSTVEDEVAPSLPPKPQRELCRVEFPYMPQNDDELYLRVGDIITIISTDLPDKGWWKGELRGKVGVFPDNFVKLLPPEVSPLNDSHFTTKAAKNSSAAAEAMSAVTTTAATTSHMTTQSSASSSTTSKTNHASSSTSTKVFVKKSGSSSSTHSSQGQGQSATHKDSFGSRDSLNDILSETGLQSGNVAATRKSLENKNIDLLNAPDGSRLAMKRAQQQDAASTVTNTAINSSPNASTGTTSSSSEVRKSLESLDEKTKTPPPVLTKKPLLGAKGILSGLKQKVKNVEKQLTSTTSHDYADGAAGSKTSPSSCGLPDAGAAGSVIMRRAATIAVEDSDFDSIERASILPDMRAGRVKAPRRRPPSAAYNAVGESNNNNTTYLNGGGGAGDTSSEEPLIKPQSSDDNSTGDEQLLAKPKPREWQTQKAPWMEELKMSQVKKKASPSVEPRGAITTNATEKTKTSAEDVKCSSSSSCSVVSSSTASSAVAVTTTKVQSSSVSSSMKHQSVSVESSQSSMSKSLITTKSSADISEDTRMRPNSLSIRNRSSSPSASAMGRASAKSAAAPASASTRSAAEGASSAPAFSSSSNATIHSTNHTSASSSAVHENNLPTVNKHGQIAVNSSSYSTTTANSTTSKTEATRVLELERRVEKLESIVQAQQCAIDELVRTLREETDRVKVLRGELDKYAQCVTQV